MTTQGDDEDLSTRLDRAGRALALPDEGARELAVSTRLAGGPAEGGLGRLAELAVWLCGVQGRCPPHPISRPRAVIFAADHGVAARGVSTFPPSATAQMVRSIAGGGATVNVLARLAGASVRVVDVAVDADLSDLPEVGGHKVRRASGDIAVQAALTRQEAERAVVAGMSVADQEVDGGADLLIAGAVGVGSSTPAAALVAVLTGAEVATVVGRGSGIDDRVWMVKCAAVRDAAWRGRSRQADTVDLLAEVGGADVAAVTGFIFQAAVRRTPVLLDGLVSAAAALAAHRIGYRALHWWLAGHAGTEPAQARALDRLDLHPIVDFGMSAGGGAGALVALPVLAGAAATFAQGAGTEQFPVAGR